jgi:hypothetical protein
MRKIPFARHIVDVFWGDGWTQWARVKLIDGKRPVILGQSRPLPKDFWNHF